MTAAINLPSKNEDFLNFKQQEKPREKVTLIKSSLLHKSFLVTLCVFGFRSIRACVYFRYLPASSPVASILFLIFKNNFFN